MYEYECWYLEGTDEEKYLGKYDGDSPLEAEIDAAAEHDVSPDDVTAILA